MEYVLLVLGLAVVTKSADYLVEGASAVASKFNVPDLIVGLTIVAFGTSLPELIVSLLSSINGNPDITIGNVIGSNISNILLILGATAIIKTIRVENTIVRREIPFSLLGVLILMVLVADNILDGESVVRVSRADGLILLSFFIIFLYFTFLTVRPGPKGKSSEAKIKLPKASLMILAGIIGLIFGGQATVSGAVDIATNFGISETIVGLTIVAIGTSLPELVTTIIAATKGSTDIAIGNVIGSNIFNNFWVLGLSALIAPITISGDIGFDLLVLLGATLVMFISLIIGKGRSIDRKEGILFLSIYIIYIVINVVRVL